MRLKLDLTLGTLLRCQATLRGREDRDDESLDDADDTE